MDHINVLLVHRKTQAEKLIQVPFCESFATLAKYVRIIEPNRSWEFYESF